MSKGSRATIVLLAALAAAGAVAAPRDGAGASRGAAQWQPPPKPTGPIAVDYRVAGAAVVGQALDVAITARSVGATGWVLEASTPDAALVIVAQTPGAGEDGERSWVVTVVPMAAGASYLNVVVTGEIEGTPQARSIVIPIRTPAAKDAATVAARDVAAEANAESLILLPVVESP